VGLIRRRQAALVGAIELTAQRLDPQVIRISAQIVNQTPISEQENQDAVLMRTFTSTHTILHLEGAEFVSLMDPPPALHEFARSCKNEGTWPVLVGDEKTADRSTMLSSPIILYDYPKIAPESPGQLFDGTEIDEILTLRVMTMTDVEKEEMRQSDERARQILERTESLPEDQLWKMHGVVRELRSLDDDFFSNDRRLDVVEVNGVQLRTGHRVRIRPKSRADILDIALEGKTAIIDAIEQDAENRIHLALVLDDDPGKDLGFMRQPGHRFFYALDEVEPLAETE
jgi:hydrogenase maturation protease